MKHILIAACSFDAAAVEPVVTSLKAQGYSCLMYQPDLVMSGRVNFMLRISNVGGAEFTYGKQAYRPADISAAWHLPPARLALEGLDGNRQLQLSYGLRSMQAGLWQLIGDDKWLNSPSQANVVGNELPQLMLAREVGFTIPNTVVTNAWDNLPAVLPADTTVTQPGGSIRSALQNTADGIPRQASPLPGIFQPRLRKLRDWRITVVGEQTFDVVIYSNRGEDMLDWRTCRSASDVRLAAERFPDGFRRSCLAFLRRLGMRYGVFDFTENEDGIYFLECSLDGQYSWLEKALELPISVAIADELAAVAERQ